jgi:2-C-methyl-D-erythritol 4-phosphate cytidylyltransferase
MGNDNIKGGLRALIEGNQEEKPQGKPMKSVEKKDERESKVKTYEFFLDDIEAIEKYARYMAFKQGKRYTFKLALSDAIALLKKKFPEVIQ